MTRPDSSGRRVETGGLDAGAATSRPTSGRTGGVGALRGAVSSTSDHGGPALLAAAFGGATVVVATYLTAHGHPAYEGGLYLEIAEAVRRNGFALPQRIHGYTDGGVPFAYPPLLFYAMAALVAATGVDPVALELYAPGLVTVACLVPFHGVARWLLPTRRQAGLATALYAVTPAVLQWHLSAGGVVRAPAMFLTLSGLYTGVRLFENGEMRWLVASTGLFALVLLSHPVYAAFFGLSYLVLFLGIDRSIRGLARGGVVAIGGLIATAPWWLVVVHAHGIDVFLGVVGTRTTIGGRAGRVLEQFVYPITALDPITPFYAAAFAGGIYAATRRRFLLPAWMVLSSYGLGEDRFTFVAGSMLSAALVAEVVLPQLADGFSGIEARRLASAVALLVLVGGAIGVGAAYAGSGLNTAYENSTTMPQTVHPADREAMAWARDNTGPSADFVVVGDQAEWFPHYAERAILVTPWGTEWTSPEGFKRHLVGYTNLSTCESAGCLERELRRFPGEAEYVYVPKRTYTVRGKERRPPHDLIDSLAASDRFEREYENGGVVVFEGTEGPARPTKPE